MLCTLLFQENSSSAPNNIGSATDGGRSKDWRGGESKTNHSLEPIDAAGAGAGEKRRNFERNFDPSTSLDGEGPRSNCTAQTTTEL